MVGVFVPVEKRLADVTGLKGIPEYIRSDNGAEVVAKDLPKWLADSGAKTLYIKPGVGGERQQREL